MAMYQVNEDAQVLMGLHAAQYPHLPVMGLLVGRDMGEGIEVTKAFPVAHQAPTAPFLEFASICIDTYATQNKLKIVGIYVANSHVDDIALGPVHTRIANTVEAQSSRACVLVLDNHKLSTPHLLLKDVKKGWIEMDKRIAFDDDQGKVLLGAIAQPNSLRVVDFDEHLEQPSKDWRNPQVLSLARLQV
ncbi:hypothetical protein THRCLA_20308 [Thraustotheca clavata]|uniref:MPN domain-containing protein n=1 Tax=Thraustotheca clavata TaxID=74557 RepID=A0A1W0A9K9_9STRA|nr:hypothetical protein THRCLA_20308 [Thraustotheca clavata]